MITKEQAAEVVRLFHAEKWKIGTIAAQLGSTPLRRSFASRSAYRCAAARSAWPASCWMATADAPFRNSSVTKKCREGYGAHRLAFFGAAASRVGVATAISRPRPLKLPTRCDPFLYLRI